MKRMLLALLGLLPVWLQPLASWAQELPRTLFVENSLGRTLSLVDLESGVVERDVVTLGEIPNDLVAYRGTLYALNSVPPEILVIDAVSREVQKRIALPEGSNPYEIALVGAHRAYVTLLVANEVAVVDLLDGRVEKRIPVGKGPQSVLVDLSAGRAYVANTGAYPDFRPASVSIIDTNTDSVVTTLPVPDNAQALAAAPDWLIYVVCSGKWGEDAGKLCVLDPWAPPSYEPAIVDTVELGGFPGDVVATPDGLLYMADWGDERNGFLYVYDVFADSVLHSRSNPLRVGKGAMRLLYDGASRALYVSNFDQDTIQEIDPGTGQVERTLLVGDGPQAMAIVGPIQSSDPWADEVVDFQPGEPWTRFGYLFFPENVLGPPTPSAAVTMYNPSNSADEILSLGHGGQIVLAFTDNVIVDDQGPDFTVFENCFVNLWTGEPFVEAGKVAVSQDGQTWFEFPYDTLTLEGLAGAHPVKNTLEPLQPEISGGDPFDLATVGLEWARYVRITDLGDEWQEGPYNGDFDLDAVVAVHSAAAPPSGVESSPLAAGTPAVFQLTANYPNPFNTSTQWKVVLGANARIRFEILDVTGRVVRALVPSSPLRQGVHRIAWDGRDDRGVQVPSGVYIARLMVEGSHAHLITRKLLLQR